MFNRKTINKRSDVILKASSLALLVGLSTSFTAQAQDGTQVSDSYFDEVIVTARKKAESSQDVPITLNVYSGEALREKGITDFELVEENTPGFTLDILGGTRARPTIRGIGSDETGPGGDPSTGVFVDGVYLGRSGQQAVEAYDLERVEVLKGPQGTLFGRNVVGGAVSFITAKPTDELDASFAITYGEFDTFNTEGFFNTPLTSNLNARVAFSTKANDGFGLNNFTGNRLSDTNRQSGRIHLAYEPTDNLDFLLSADVTRDDTNGTVGNTHRLNGVDITNDDPFRNNAEIDGFGERESWGVGLTTNIGIGSATLTNITSYREIEEGFLDDIDGFNRIENPEIVNVDLGFTDDASQFTTETRLAGDIGNLGYVAGVYFSNEEGDGEVILRIDGTGAANVTEAFDTDLFFTGAGDTNAFAVFGEVDYSLTDRFNLSGGLRYSRDTKDFTGAFFVAGGAVQVRTESIEDVSFDEVTWRVSGDYEVADDILLFGTISTGFKSGAFPLIATAPNQFITPLDPETAINYEVGLKADLFGGRTRLNLSAFIQDFDNLQIISVSGGDEDAAFNVPSADINGIEIDTSTFLTDNFGFDFKYTYLDATYGDLGPDNPISGAQVIRTPKHDLSLSGRFSHDLGDKGSLLFVPQLSYRSQVFDDTDNNPEELRPARTIINGSIAWISPDETWEVGLFGRNITNENYFNRVANIPGTAGQSTSGDPRHYGIQLRWHLN